MNRNILSILATVALMTAVNVAWSQEPDVQPAPEGAELQQQDRVRARIHDPALTPEERQAMREQWQAMSTEERARAREERLQEWEAMSPEDQARVREEMRVRREERRQQWQSMTPEEQAQVREQRRQRLEGMTPAERDQLRERRHDRRQTHTAVGGSGRQGGGKGRGGNF
ncbi:MAG: hypothetical protein AMJ59_09800 [Gammaproteobacteria bacterium SG8_31]|jgi:hypothetical protein|nr:MAG: hypothetical protein AMJ59_09800 [Gammaproteobacteria bacterium SG8_31]